MEYDEHAHLKCFYLYTLVPDGCTDVTEKQKTNKE